MQNSSFTVTYLTLSTRERWATVTVNDIDLIHWQVKPLAGVDQLHLQYYDVYKQKNYIQVPLLRIKDHKTVVDHLKSVMK